MNFLNEIINNPKIAEWFLNIFLKSSLVIIIGLIIITVLKRKNIPFIEKTIVSIMLISIIIPIIPIISAWTKDLHFKPLHNEIRLTNEYIIVNSDKAPIKNENKSLDMISLINIIGIIWMLIFFLKTVIIMYRLRYLHRLKKNLRDYETYDFHEIPGLKYSKNKPKIYLSDTNHSPVCFGFFKPVILIPKILHLRLNKESFQAIVLHELSHINRKDHITGIIQELLKSFYWWNPLVYRISKEFTNLSEIICDTSVINSINPKVYAKTLISVIENTSTVNKMPGVSGITSFSIDLKERIKKIINKETKMETKLKKYLSIIIVLSSITFLTLLSSQNFIFANKGINETSKESISTKEKTNKVEIKKDKVYKVSRREIIRTKYVAPKFPKKALEAKVNGLVILEVIVDVNGKVTAYKILKGHPLLNRAAIDAVKQWEYQPYKKDGKFVPITFNITITFMSNKNRTRIHQARRIKYVKPVYPEDALKNKISGKVVIEASTDLDGNIVNCRVISGHPVLNKAAIDAVNQWKYEPYYVKGKKKPVTFTVTVTFSNDKNQKNKKK